MKIITHTQIDGEDVLDINQVSELTGLNRNKIYELLRYEKMPNPVKAKNKNFWKRAEIEEYLTKTKK